MGFSLDTLLVLISRQISFSSELLQGGGWRKAFLLLFMQNGQNPGGLWPGIPWSCFQPPEPLRCPCCTGVAEIYCLRSFSFSVWGHVPIRSTSFEVGGGALLLQSLQSRGCSPHAGRVLPTAEPAAPPAWGLRGQAHLPNLSDDHLSSPAHPAQTLGGLAPPTCILGSPSFAVNVTQAF